MFKGYKTCTWVIKFQDELIFGDRYHTKNSIIKELQSEKFTIFKGNEELLNRQLDIILIAENYIPLEDFTNALQR